MQHPKASARHIFTQAMNAAVALAFAACLMSTHSTATAGESIDDPGSNSANHHSNRHKISSGGYAVQTNMGGSEAATFTEAVLFFGFDPAVVGYRVNAAAAKYSRVEATEMYGRHRPYGYLCGGSIRHFMMWSAEQISAAGWENLDFRQNAGHSIAASRPDRL